MDSLAGTIGRCNVALLEFCGEELVRVLGPVESLFPVSGIGQAPSFEGAGGEKGAAGE